MARYRATRQGFDGRVVRQPGEAFDFDGNPGSWMEPLEGVGLTKRDIMAQLDALGIEYNQRAAKDDLAALLDDAQRETEQ